MLFRSLATPLQIVNSYSALVNGGTLYAPNLGKRILDPITGETQVEFAPRVLKEIFLPDAFSEPILEGLAAVTTWRSEIGTEGTAYSADQHMQLIYTSMEMLMTLAQILRKEIMVKNYTQ